jgi:large subunit ribosomal protein L29
VKPSEIREWDLPLLKEKEIEFKRRLQQLRFQIGFGQLTKNDAIRKQRRDIARIKTIIKEKTDAQARAAMVSEA